MSTGKRERGVLGVRWVEYGAKDYEQTRNETRARTRTASDDERHDRGHLKLNKGAPRGRVQYRIADDEGMAQRR